MKADRLLRELHRLDDEAFAEIVVWKLPRAMPGSSHRFKYRLAYVVKSVCVIRYDNEAGKGDHRHIGRREQPYEFVDLDSLQADFWRDVDEWRRK